MTNDDQRAKQTKRSTSKIGRQLAALDRLDVPDRSCATCQAWTQTEDTWGECEHTLVVMERIPRGVLPPEGMEKGTTVAQWPNPGTTGVTCMEPHWQHARTFGRAVPLRTHRTFACDRYQGQPANVIAFPRRGPSLQDRVRGERS